jgi:demethylmenaquinone methyltransferase/2-methoxy-6-polyprenyl-1,4-benzoquinol methylase
MNSTASAPRDQRAEGARTANEVDEQSAAANVRDLFTSIAPTYDRLNHLLSFGLDRRWWRRTALTFRSTLARPDARILDICCGTGDLTAALLTLRPQPSTTAGSPGAPPSASSLTAGQGGVHDLHTATIPEPITGLDFSAGMLTLARAKYPTQNIRWIEADAMALPYPNNSFDLVTSAFGFRNLTNYAAALAEIHRVLRPGGRIGILEANQPGGLSGALYSLYFKHILPLVGGLLSGDRPAYRYLPASVARFPRPPRMLQLMQKTGFTNCAWDPYLLRAAGLYHATKPH